jgi:hypothetical protein
VRLQISIDRPYRAPRTPEGIRSAIIASAEYFHSHGVDSRIPLLKRAFGRDAPDGSTARREDGIPVPEWGEGKLLLEPIAEEAVRFNIFNADAGLQAFHTLPFENDRTSALIVVRCKTTWVGDLRISITDDPRVPISSGATYSNMMNSIVMRSRLENLGFVSAHELEHALHANLALMVKGHPDAIPARRMEYLAMLYETLHCGSFPLVDIALRRWPGMLRVGGQVPHIASSFGFLVRLSLKYGISTGELAKHQREYYRTGKISPRHEEMLQRVWQCALSEYLRIYEKEFGISRAELAGIITELPMI